MEQKKHMKWWLIKVAVFTTVFYILFGCAMQYEQRCDVHPSFYIFLPLMGWLPTIGYIVHMYINVSRKSTK